MISVRPSGSLTGMIAIVISAVLCSLSFPNALTIDGFPLLAWIALVPLLIGLRNIDGKNRLWAGLIFGAVAYGLILQWLWPLHVLGTMLFVLVLTIQPMIFIYFYRETQHPIFNLLYVPSLWVVSEWMRTLFLQGFCFSLGYSQAFVPSMIQSAAWGGTYAVAFVIVLVNSCLYSAIQVPRRRKLYLASALAIVVINFCYGWGHLRDLPGKPLGIAVAGIQANIEPHIKLDPDHFDANIQKHVELTRNIPGTNQADLIVWPETAFPWDVRKDQWWFPQMQQLARDSEAGLVLGTAAIENGRDLNSAFVLDAQGRPSGIYHKNHLIPFCEFCPSPWLRRFPHLSGFDFLAGTEQKVFPLTAGTEISARFGVLICSESCYPKSARRLTDLGADFILVILNDGWFKKPEAIMIHAQNAVLRAVETGRDVVSVGNTGGTFRVSRQGVIGKDELLGLQQAAAGRFAVTQGGHRTIYSRIGDIFAVVCLLFVIMILFFTNRNPFKD